VAKHKITREAAEAHDAEVREHVKRQQAAWEEKHTLMLALGHALPEGRLTPAARKQLQKRADKIVRSALIKLLKGEELDFEMRRLALRWLEQPEHGRGRPAKALQKLLVQQAVWDEYKKHLPKVRRIGGFTISTVRKQPLHKEILGKVGDCLGIGDERMKQLAPRGPDPIKVIDKAIERITSKPKRK